MKTRVTRIHDWHMGHRVPNHKSLCRNVHGHTYEIHVTLEGDVVNEQGVSEEGMVIDFSDVKRIVADYIDGKLDHGYMGHKEHDKPVLLLLESLGMKHMAVDFIPTAENISKFLFDELSPLFEDVYGTNLKLVKIKLYETKKNFIEYEPGT